MPRAVRITKLQLTDFRNHQHSQLEFSQDCVIFSGINGAGKTNILEALSFLSPGRGMRRAVYPSICRQKTDTPATGWSVFCHLAVDGEEITVGTGYREGESGRRLRINGQDMPGNDALADICRISWLTPDMDDLFRGTAGNRRRYLDRLVLAIDPHHGRRVADYEKLMRGRNRVLEESGNGRPLNDSYLEVLESQLAELAIAIGFARKNLLERLAGQIMLAENNGAFPQPGLALLGDFEAFLDENPAVDAESRFKTLLAQQRPRDSAAGRMLNGPHRSDLQVQYLAKNMPAAHSSTGEQKGLLIAIFLAHAALTASQSNLSPILLLDEVVAHLDKGRQQALFTRLFALKSQFFITATNASNFDGVGDADFLSLENGEVIVG